MDTLEFLREYQEDNRIEAKRAQGGLPHSLWETYSAFANTYGGLILLGVEELPDHSLRVQGLLNPEELAAEFRALLNDRSVVSSNILTDDQIRVEHAPGGDIVVIEVPPASPDQLPVYLGKSPFTGAYRRSGDGDYHCTRAELNAMLGGKAH